MRNIISRFFVSQLVTIPTETSQIPSLLLYQLDNFVLLGKFTLQNPNSGTVVKIASMSGDINTYFGTRKELSCFRLRDLHTSNQCPFYVQSTQIDKLTYIWLILQIL